jgi:hypothetical protein
MVRRVLPPAALALALVALAAGCGGRGKPVKVSGVLTWEDGTPVGGVTLTFVPQQAGGKTAAGYTGKDGTFELTTTNSGDGALPGEYKVVVIPSEGSMEAAAPSSGPGSDMTRAMQEWARKKAAGATNAAKTPVPRLYTTDQSTPLKWTVESGGPRVELKLKKV